MHPLMGSTKRNYPNTCYSGTKRTEVRDGILEANPDVAIVTETWLQEGDQDLMVQGYIPIKRCDRKNTNGKKLPANEKGGGVLVIAKDYITIMEAESYHVDKSRWYPSYWTKRQFSQSIDLLRP